MHQIQFNSSDYINMYNSFNKHLQHQTDIITEQVESVVIDRNINNLWEVLQDWDKFQKLAPTIADRVE
jgi:coenzyme F420-reducing hydrogenase delta subunit